MALWATRKIAHSGSVCDREVDGNAVYGKFFTGFRTVTEWDGGDRGLRQCRPALARGSGDLAKPSGEAPMLRRLRLIDGPESVGFPSHFAQA